MTRDDVPDLDLSEPSAGDPVEKRGYHHGHLREALVAAGIEALEREPLRDVRVRELARRVGVSPNAAYRHFADRDALLAAVAAEGFRRFHAASTQAMTTARSALHAQGRSYVRFAREHPALFRLMFGPMSSTSTDELASASAATFHLLREAVAVAVGTTDLNDPRVNVGAVYAWSVVHGLSYLALDGRLDETGDIDELIDAVLAYADR